MIEPLVFQDVGTGPALLLVHGSFSNGTASWSKQARSLPAHVRMIIPDRRGYGNSPKEPRAYTIESDAGDILALIRRLEIERFHLAGHSSGGLVAIELARLIPEDVLSLHLIEPPYMSLLSHTPASTPMMRGAGAVFANARQLGPEATAIAFFTALIGQSGVERLRGTKAWESIVAEAGRIAYEQNPGEYPSNRLFEVRISVPVCVYIGGRSNPAHHAIARIMVERIVGSRLIVAPEAGHSVQLASNVFDREMLAVIASEV